MTEKQLRQRQGKSKPVEAANVSKKERDKKNKFAAAHDELQHATSPVTHRILTRAVIVTSVMIIVYFYTENEQNETNFALTKEHLPLRMQKFKCSEEYEKEISKFPQCVPRKCGRFVKDNLLEHSEVEALLEMATNVIDLAGSSGGASILDLNTGALSYGEKFVNAFKMPKTERVMKEEYFNAFRTVREKIQYTIAEQFGINEEDLFLTYPTFMSRITNATAKTVHDEYWHEHVDKETYPSFHYTSLLYLNTFNKDFKGGKFIFVDNKGDQRVISAIEPKKGRVSAFSSGFENRHHVEKVTEGARYAVTISFTCDRKQSMGDPHMKNDVSLKHDPHMQQ